MTAKVRRQGAKTSSAHPTASARTGQLLFVATPIGNLGDITLRALEALKAADAIACEDTRHAQKLLTHYGIKKPLLAYHDHNESSASQKLVARVMAGDTIAVISDAGLPLIANPGYGLIKEAIKAGINTSMLPGANAALMALALSGLPTDSFTFGGFLPNKASARQARLAKMAAIPITLVFYETPQRLVDALADAERSLGDRPAAVARELTKRFEEVRRGTLSELLKYYKANEPKGEIVLVIGGADETQVVHDTDALLQGALKNHSVKQAAQMVAAQTGASVRDTYARALQLKGKKT